MTKEHLQAEDSVKRICILLLFLFSPVWMHAQSSGALEKEPGGWDKASEILSRIKTPDFPDRDFLITEYGAIAGGNNDCSSAIGKSIEACQKAGGGRVVVPSGVFLTGP